MRDLGQLRGKLLFARVIFEHNEVVKEKWQNKAALSGAFIPKGRVGILTAKKTPAGDHLRYGLQA
jgi:hypothetical protein